MNKNFSIWSRVNLIVLLLSVILFPMKTFAADNPNSEGIKAFREALTAKSDAKDRVFRQDIMFASPLLTAELDLLGLIDNNTLKSSGNLSVSLYNDDGTVTDNSIPYYIVQQGKDMALYYKYENKWQKFTVPELASVIVDVIATPTESEIDDIIADTKDVQILEENNNRRIMLVTLDGDRLAESLKTKANEHPSTNANGIQEEAVGYFDTALRNANIWYMWTVDKRDWHTVAMQYHFSGVIQELARAALKDPTKNWPDEFAQLIETFAYYSEIRAYTTYPADPKAKQKIEIPKEVLKAKEVGNLLESTSSK